MVIPDINDEELSLSGDLKVNEMPLEAQKRGSPPKRIRKLAVTVAVLLFTNVFLAASTVTLYCFCKDLSRRLDTLENTVQSKTGGNGHTVQSNLNTAKFTSEEAVGQLEELPTPLRQVRNRRRHVDGVGGRNRTSNGANRCPSNCKGRRGKKGVQGDHGPPGICQKNCSTPSSMPFVHLPAEAAPANSSDLFHFKVPESAFPTHFRVLEGHKVEVTESGVYFVYSQVMYNNVAARNGFLLKTRMAPDGPEENFIACILGSGGAPSNDSDDQRDSGTLVYKPCFTAGTIYLKAGSTLWFEHPYAGPGHEVKLRPHLTFLGLIRLSPG